MCGIAGISFNRGKKASTEIGVEVFKSFLSENTERGKDSTGICYLEDEYFQVVRGFLPGVSAKNLVACDANTSGIIAHTRHATIGNKTNRKNIHPFETENYVGVHNGTIFNYKLLKEKYKAKPKGTSDSEIIYSIMDKIGTSVFKEIEGTYLLAYTNLSATDTINIITNGSKPMVFIKAHGLFVAFGSIGEKSIETWSSFFDKVGIRYTIERILPCTLYKLKNGKIYKRVDYSNKIKFMSEKEGDIRFKLDFKNIKSDEYKITIPASRRLYPGKPAQISSATVEQGNLFHHKGNYVKTAKNENKNYTHANKVWLDETIGAFRSLFRESLETYTKSTEVFVDVEYLSTLIRFTDTKHAQDYTLETIFDNNKIIYPILQQIPSKKDETVTIVSPNLLSVEILTKLFAFSGRITFVKTLNNNTGSVCSYLAKLFVGLCNNEILGDIEKYIQENLIEKGVVNPEFLVFKDSSTKYNYLYTRKIALMQRAPILQLFVAKDLLGKRLYNMTDITKVANANGSTATVSDFNMIGNAWYFIATISRIVEKMAVLTKYDRIVKKVEKPSLAINPIEKVAEDLLKNYYGGYLDPLDRFTEKAKNNITGNGLNTEVYNSYRALVEAQRESFISIKNVDYNTLYSLSPFIDPISEANMRVDGDLKSIIETTISKSLLIRRYLVDNKVIKEEDLI